MGAGVISGASSVYLTQHFQESPISQSPPYTPPAELVATAERALAEATLAELAKAEALYLAYGSVTDGKSAVTGATLPPFAECRPLVQSGWLAASRV